MLIITKIAYNEKQHIGHSRIDKKVERWEKVLTFERSVLYWFSNRFILVMAVSNSLWLSCSTKAAVSGAKDTSEI